MNKKTLLKILVGIAVIALLIYLYTFTSLREFLTPEGLRKVIEPFGMLAPLVFMIIYIVALLLLVPASAFSVASGVLFGTLKGFFYVLFAATVAAGIGFYLARKLRGENSEKYDNPVIASIKQKVEKRLDEHGLQTFLILRLVYTPYMALSYAAGLVQKAKFKDFIIATFLGNIIGSFTFVFLGAQLGQGWKALILPVTLVVVALFIPKIVKKFRKEEK